ncbi:MAG: hypothetical protein SPL55_08130 [Prevotella sp.]|nr:hypothetical protein [Prevotella sp.]
MKQKLLTLLAAVLLGSISAFAQNTNPVKGDVNEDGTVDVADLVNVIKIMKEGGGAVGEKMCYWYAGTNNGNAVTADNFTDVASRIAESEVPETGSVTANGQYVYFIMPETKHIESLTDGNGSAVEFTCTDVMGYHIYRTNDKINGSVNYNIAQTLYYWYVGTTKPTSLSQATTVTSYPAEQIYTNNSGAKAYIYVLTNNDRTVTFIEPNTGTTLGQQDIDTTTIPGYKIFGMYSKTLNTGSVKIRIS